MQLCKYTPAGLPICNNRKIIGLFASGGGYPNKYHIDLLIEMFNLEINMPDTYTQLYIHCVFAVKYRQALIQPEWEHRLQKYITGIVQNNGHKLLAINNVPDHMHLLIGLNPKQSVSEIMRLIKGDSSEFINKERLTNRKFHWQEGYGAFSNSRSQIDSVFKYILNQKEHHRKRTFKEEYLSILKDYDVDYNDKYVFEELID